MSIDRTAICVIAYNEEQNIFQLTKKILTEKIRDSHLFVDSAGSTDSTRVLVESLVNKYPRYITHINSPKRVGRHVAYNYLLKRVARYQIVVFVDADLNLGSNSLKRIIEWTKSHGELKIIGSLTLPELVNKTRFSRIITHLYRKLRSKIFDDGRYIYLNCKIIAARVKDLPKIPEKIYADEFYLNLQYEPEEMGICRESLAYYVMPYTLSGLLKHSIHLGKSLREIRNDYPILWRKQLQRIPLVDYIVFGLSKFGFRNFWKGLDLTEKFVFIYTRLVTIVGFVIGLYFSGVHDKLRSPIKETKIIFE